jgi:hypothetical protein
MKGKRRKIHNFPLHDGADAGGTLINPKHPSTRWERRLANLEAATSLTREQILDRALEEFALKLLRADVGSGG